MNKYKKVGVITLAMTMILAAINIPKISADVNYDLSVDINGTKLDLDKAKNETIPLYNQANQRYEETGKMNIKSDKLPVEVFSEDKSLTFQFITTTMAEDDLKPSMESSGELTGKVSFDSKIVSDQFDVSFKEDMIVISSKETVDLTGVKNISVEYGLSISKSKMIKDLDLTIPFTYNARTYVYEGESVIYSEDALTDSMEYKFVEPTTKVNLATNNVEVQKKTDYYNKLNEVAKLKNDDDYNWNYVEVMLDDLVEGSGSFDINNIQLRTKSKDTILINEDLELAEKIVATAERELKFYVGTKNVYKFQNDVSVLGFNQDNKMTEELGLGSVKTKEIGDIPADVSFKLIVKNHEGKDLTKNDFDKLSKTPRESVSVSLLLKHRDSGKIYDVSLSSDEAKKEYGEFQQGVYDVYIKESVYLNTEDTKITLNKVDVTKNIEIKPFTVIGPNELVIESKLVSPLDLGFIHETQTIID